MDKRGGIFVGIFAVLLVSVSLIFSVGADSSNIKIYDDLTKTAIIKDASNVDIVSATLNTPQDYHVGAGYGRVAQFTISPKQDLGNILSSFEFYDLRDGRKAVQKQIDVKYLTIQEIVVDDYKTECSIILNEKNETEVCNQVKSGSHIEQQEAWLPFDGNVKTDEQIIIGLFTDVQINEKIEWVPTITGVKVNEWAVWTADLNVGLVAYYKLDEQDTTGTGTIYDALFIHNGTNAGADNSSGKISTAYNYNGANDYINLNNNSLLGGVSAFTISAWVYHDTASGTDVIIGSWTAPLVTLFRIDETDLQFYTKTSVGQAGGTTQTLSTTGAWLHIVAVYNGTTMMTYVNGVQSATTYAQTGTIVATGGENYFIGKYQTSGFWDGKIDEVGIWNRALTEAEITNQLWNGGTGITYTNVFDTISPETTQPTITPSTPNSSASLYCNATLTDDLQTNLTAYWAWYKNNITNLTGIKTGISNNTNTIITTLLSGNTIKGQEWKCEVLPFDGYNYGIAKNSSFVTILNTPPTQNNPLLTTPSGKNFHYENLTCYNQSTYDADGDNVISIYNWYKNSQPLAVLNMPFEINAKDYSDYENNGAIYGSPQFVTGKIGRALSFDGIDDYVNVGSQPSLDDLTEFTWEAWIKMDTLTPNLQKIVDKNYKRTRVNSNGALQMDITLSTNIASSITSAGVITIGQWYHTVFTYGDSGDRKVRIYVNGVEQNYMTQTAGIGTLSSEAFSNLLIGTDSLWFFNGTIDEVRIYPYVLTPEQIQANYNLEYNKIVSEETAGGDNYMCQITPIDGEEDGTTLNSNNLSVLWGITFNATSGEDGSQITQLDNIVCNNSWSSGSISSPFEFGFLSGNYECAFSKTNYYDKTITFTADNDKIIDIKLSRYYHLTVEEHTWLEAIYNCLYSGDCSLYNLLLEVNQTIGKIWDNTKPTDENVVTTETITNKVVDSTHNLTIDYSVNIPIKAGYVSGTYLPVRIGYWFLNEANTSCYNQGDKPTEVEDPYCQPLIIETLGPMGGQVNFMVKLHPELPAGNYSIKRIIDIDPNNVWINYGQENIGSFIMAESLNNYGITVEKTWESNPSVNAQQQSNPQETSGGGSSGSTTTIIKEKETIIKEGSQGSNTENNGKSPEENNNPGITGGVIGTLLSGKQITFIITILCGTFIIFIIVRHRIIKLKKI